MNSDFSRIQELIGMKEAHNLTDTFGGAILYIPMNDIINRRHRYIRESFKNGKNYHEIARESGYTIRHIRRIIHSRKISIDDEYTTSNCGGLEDFLNPDNCKTIVQHFGGEAVYIPKNVLVAEKHRCVLRDHAAGMKVKSLAHKYGYSVCNIYRIIQKNKTQAVAAVVE
jgi:Mor family transcriptional regulator